MMIYNDKVALKNMIINAMKRDNTWEKSADKYIALYEEALLKK
jgi:glycogen synthase